MTTTTTTTTTSRHASVGAIGNAQAAPAGGPGFGADGPSGSGARGAGLSLVFAVAVVLGLAVVAWVGLGHVSGSPLALALVGLIGVAFGLGAWELHGVRRASRGLVRVLDETTAVPPSAALWLDRLPAAMQAPVRQRLEGERTLLPGPVLAHYLVGALVLLGMLGTFLGMVATLRGTGAALTTALDVAAIRASLAAPVQGLGLAFGASVAGVATSALLGLLAALVRRERLGAWARLEETLGTTLRPLTRAHRLAEERARREAADAARQAAAAEERAAERANERAEALRLQQAAVAAQEEALRTQQAALAAQQASLLRFEGWTQAQAASQAEATTALLQQLQGLVARLDERGETLRQGLLDQQSRFHGEARHAYATLAETVGRSLEASLAESARQAGAAFGPAVRETMDTVARETAALRQALGDAVQRQVDGIASTLDVATTSLAERWQAAMALQQQQGEAALQGVQARAEAAAAGLQSGLDRFSASFEQRATALVDGVAARFDQSATHWDAQWTGHWAEVLAAQQAAQQALQSELVQRQLQTHEMLVAQHRGAHEALLQASRDQLAGAVEGLATRGDALLQGLADARGAWDEHAAARERERMAAFHDALAAMAATWQREGAQVAEAITARQQRIAETLERSAGSITAQAEAHTRATVDEIGKLLHSASEAPRAAAEVMGELRQALGESLARDTAQLEERNRLIGTLGTLLESVNLASREQWAAIDGLVQATTQVLSQAGTGFSASLEQAGAGFAASVERGSAALAESSAQVAGSAAEMAAMGEGFAVAVQQFGQASEQLMGQLGRIESALGRSMARSDEQLAYYVAQAREIVDLTLGSQQQIVEDMHRLARAPSGAGPTALPDDPAPAATDGPARRRGRAEPAEAGTA